MSDTMSLFDCLLCRILGLSSVNLCTMFPPKNIFYGTIRLLPAPFFDYYGYYSMFSLEGDREPSPVSSPQPTQKTALFHLFAACIEQIPAAHKIITALFAPRSLHTQLTDLLHLFIVTAGVGKLAFRLAQ